MRLGKAGGPTRIWLVEAVCYKRYSFATLLSWAKLPADAVNYLYASGRVWLPATEIQKKSLEDLSAARKSIEDSCSVLERSVALLG